MLSVVERIIEPTMVQENKARTDGGVSKGDNNSSSVMEEVKAGKPLSVDMKRNENELPTTLPTPKSSSVFVKLASPISFGTVDTEDESEPELDSPERKETTHMVSRRIRWSDESGENLTKVQVFQNNVEEVSIRIVLLLLHPTKKSTFEFVHCEFLTEHRLLVSDVIDQIPHLATCSYFQKKKTRKFRSLIRDAPPHHELINILAVQDYTLRNGEILVAVPTTAKPKKTLARAHRLLQSDDKFLRKAVKRAHISGRALRTLHSSAGWRKVRKAHNAAKKSVDGSKVGEDTQQTESSIAQSSSDCIYAQGITVEENVSFKDAVDGKSEKTHRESKKTKSMAGKSVAEALSSFDRIIETPFQEHESCKGSVGVESTPEVSKLVYRDCEATSKENCPSYSIAGPMHRTNDSPANSTKEHESTDEHADEDDNRFLSEKVMRKYDKAKAAKLSVKKMQGTPGQKAFSDIKKTLTNMPEEALRAHKKAKAAVIAAKGEKKCKRKKRMPNTEKKIESDDGKETIVGLEKETADISAEETMNVKKGRSSIADVIACDEDDGAYNPSQTDSCNKELAIPDRWMEIRKEDDNGSCESTKELQIRNKSEWEDRKVVSSEVEEQHVDVEPVDDVAVIKADERGDFQASQDAFEQVHADVWINVIEKPSDEAGLKEVAPCEGDYSDRGMDIENEVFLNEVQEPPLLYVELGEQHDADVALSQCDLDDVHPFDEIGDYYMENITDEDGGSPEEDTVQKDIERDGEEYADCANLALEGTEDIEYEGEDYEDCPVLPKARWCHLDNFDDIPDDLSFPIEI